jgi:hypothetical protein
MYSIRIRSSMTYTHHRRVLVNTTLYRLFIYRKILDLSSTEDNVLVRFRIWRDEFGWRSKRRRVSVSSRMSRTRERKKKSEGRQRWDRHGTFKVSMRFGRSELHISVGFIKWFGTGGQTHRRCSVPNEKTAYTTCQRLIIGLYTWTYHLIVEWWLQQGQSQPMSRGTGHPTAR